MTKTLTQQQQQVWDALRHSPEELEKQRLEAEARRKRQHHFNGDIKLMKTVMYIVTSDCYAERYGSDYWRSHADAITHNFDGDWSWEEAIAYWDDEDIAAAIADYDRLTPQQRQQLRDSWQV